MEITAKKYWFRGIVARTPEIRWLAFAEDAKEARKQFGCLGSVGDVDKVTWADMECFIGAVRPCYAKAEDFVTESPIMLCKGKLFCMLHG